MLISGLKMRGIPVLSLHLGGEIARTAEPIIDPNNLKIIAFRVEGAQVGGEHGTILETRSVREFANMGMIVDSIDELVNQEDVIRLDEIMKIGFSLIGKQVESKDHKRLGKVIDYTVDPGSFQVAQIIVKRPVMKGFLDPELTIGRSEVVEVNDRKVIVRDGEEKALKRAGAEDFVPNFVNPFRKEPNFAPIHNQSLGEEDTE